MRNKSTEYKVRSAIRTLSIITPISSLLFPLTAQAICPVCTVAVGAGVGLSRWLGIDDTISGIWIGGLLVSLSFWTENWLTAKKMNFKGSLAVIMAVYTLLAIGPLKWMGVTGHPFNRFYGWDKLYVGIVAGGVIFAAAAVLYDYLKERNGGHAWFPYQKVAMPVGSLALLSLVFYFLT